MVEEKSQLGEIAEHQRRTRTIKSELMWRRSSNKENIKGKCNKN
jgi:hypothetical protein